MWRKLWKIIQKIWSTPLGDSISDIPARFRTQHSKDDFIIWLAELPVADPVKRNLVHTWSRLTGGFFTSSDYSSIGLNPTGK